MDSLKPFNIRWLFQIPLHSQQHVNGECPRISAIIDGIKGVTKAMKNTDLPALRRVTFSPQSVGAAARIGQTAFKRLYQRVKNLRIPPFAIAGIITYLESRRVQCPEGDPICSPFPREINRNINELYAKAFSGALLNPANDWIPGSLENGHFFDLAVLASSQLLYETTDEQAEQPIDIEQELNVQLYKKQGEAQIPFGRPYQRKVDVTLFGDGAGQNVLVEAKSKKRPVNNADYTVWNFSRGKKVGRKLIHKQFFLDRVATTKPPIVNTPALASDFEWWFHGFNRSGFSGYTETDLSSIIKKLQKLPNDGGKQQRNVSSNTLGGNNTVGLRQKLHIFTVKQWLMDQAKQHLFADVGEDAWNILVVNSTHDL